LPERDPERGSVTAEFAVVMPALMLCLGICIGAINIAAQQVRLIDAAAVAARLIGRGDDAATVITASGAREFDSSTVDGLVCVRLAVTHSLAGFEAFGIPSEANACAVAESEQGDAE
jgi:Flp pilus assembly protein TadG